MSTFDEQDFWIERTDPRDVTKKIRLYGVLRVPKGAAERHRAYPAVVCAHGFTANHAEADPYAIGLASRGFVSLSIDFFGGGWGIRSDGTLLDMTVETERDDLLAFVDALTLLPYVDADNVCLLGCSQGGFVSTMAAAARPRDVRALCLMYPAFVLHDDALALYPQVQDVPDSYPAFDFAPERSTISREYNLVARRTDPYRLMTAYPGQVLIVHGDADAIVPLSYAQRAQQTFAHARLEVMEGGDHGLRGDYLPRAVEFATEFLSNSVVVR
ncbi:MAG: alpha/beta fold hydrolase [Coriobacteriales bacterium]|nr:alpha/beta fold hydrolase [Coriobacteriales bacterium]